MSQRTQHPPAKINTAPTNTVGTSTVEIGTIAIDADITLRRMVARPVDAPRKPSRDTILLLHGFPETVFAWQKVAPALAADYEVHAFDWPGFGLSSRPPVERFSFAPRDYARVLKDYIDQAGIDRARLTIYATDIGALPALLLALEEPGIARSLIVGDFAPFNRPALMSENLQRLKAKATADQVRAFMNANRDEILANIFRRGLPEAAQYEVSRDFRDDMERGWSRGDMTVIDAFYHYYAHFTRDQEYFEANVARLAMPVSVIWGSEDLYIRKEMGIELAARIGTDIKLLPGIGHFPHLQAPDQTIAEIRATMR